MTEPTDVLGEFLNQPADEVPACAAFMVCPNCSAAYLIFHSPGGSVHTRCDNCGWPIEEDG